MAANNLMEPTPYSRGSSWRVCRAWRTTSGVEVLGPGIRGAEGKEKGKGVVARRGLEEAQSKDAGRPVCVRTHRQANRNRIRGVVRPGRAGTCLRAEPHRQA